MTIAIHGFTSAGGFALQNVYAALSRFAPEQVAHFSRVIREIRYAPSMCVRGAIACVRADHSGVMFLAVRPEHLPYRELARVLRHEADHWSCDHGQWRLQPHTCGDPLCSVASERDDDPIYAADMTAMPRLDRALLAAGWQPDLPHVTPPPHLHSEEIPWRQIAAVVLGGLVIGGLVVAAARA